MILLDKWHSVFKNVPEQDISLFLIWESKVYTVHGKFLVIGVSGVILI